MREIYKTFNNKIPALMGADLSICEGEIHALVGENAAGKTTLMNILYGMVQPDRGKIFINGKECKISHPMDAIRNGIGMVHQHVNLVPEFSALENIILGRENRYTNRIKTINYSKAKKVVEELLSKLNIDLDLYQRIDEMSIGKQSKTEIIKALFAGSKIIIFDEPTTILAPNEIDNFLEFLEILKIQGYTMIYISHRLKEIFRISDSITVLRKGKSVKTVKTKNSSMEEIASTMVGSDEISTLSTKRKLAKRNNPILRLENVVLNGYDKNVDSINLTVFKGEILGIAGVEGNGQVELSDALIGLTRIEEGNIYLNERKINNLPTSLRRFNGLHYVPENRIHKGLALDMSVAENAILGYENTNLISKKHIMNWKNAKNFTRKIINDFNVECSNNVDEKIRNLSGGNMQKMIIGREIINNPSIVILAQPTAGLDFGSQMNIHKKILSLKDKGCSFLLISTDIDEIMSLSDRVLALYRCRIVKEFSDRQAFDGIEIGYYITGVKGYEKYNKKEN
ncbi:MAG: ABC transporter ATP-binding protein [Candidatus Methanofastidiosa archaeon]|nr:ABC transporter ATP-binding protein [Candidatus Methanofastidiosa archaeon]